MSFWDILGIAQTDDEDSVKRAYRAKIKYHHPEDDPDGFKRLKQAYDQALAHVNQPAATAAFSNPIPDRINANLVTQFDEIFVDPQKRFSKESWETWQQTFLLASLAAQREASIYAIDTVLANRWLPGNMIRWLWDIFQWQHLNRSGPRDLELGEFLQNWADEKLTIPLDALSSLDNAQQRAVLLRLRPITQSRISYNPRMMLDALLSPGPYLHLHIPTYWLTMLQAFKTTYYWPEQTTLHAIEHLITLHHSALSQNDWRLISIACDAVKLPEQQLIAIGKIVEGQHYALGAECLYQWIVSGTHDEEKHLTTAFLYQQWAPQPDMWWCFQPKHKGANTTSPQRLNFLTNALHGEHSNFILSPLQHSDISGFSDTTYAGIWAGLFGNTRDMELWHTLCAQQECENKEDVIILTLLGAWLIQQHGKQPYSGSLETKLNKYCTEDWFSTEALTEEEIASLTQEQWLTLYYKFPLLPNSWIHALVDKGIFTAKLFNSSLFPKNLGFHRIINPEFDIVSPLGGQSFEGDILWLLMFYQATSKDLCYIYGHLPPLPPTTLSPCPLTTLLPLMVDQKTVNLDCCKQLEAYPEQFVFDHIIHVQALTLQEDSNFEELVVMAKTEPLYLAALIGKLTADNDIDSAIICWNILRAYATQSRIYTSTVGWSGYNLRELCDNSEEEFNQAPIGSQLYLRKTLFENIDWLLPAEEYKKHSPPPRSSAYYYPMGYLISMLHHGPDKKEINLSILNPLALSECKLTEREKAIADLSIVALDKKYQQTIEQDVQEKGSNAISHSRRSIYLYAIVLFIMLWTLPNINLVASINWHVVFTLGQVVLFYRILRVLPPSKRIFCMLPIALELGMWFDSDKDVYGIAIGLFNVFSGYRLNRLGYKGKWEKNIVKSKTSPIKKSLYKRGRQPVI
ncbi:J domain-containing protein [Vibrio nereis]|uniref:J domain-containing protein n=1 Tax=Vibrio nereis TaxID=693 RepID=UPI00249576A0|nr:J domain-containing protein [Vibrio nereis]